MDVIENSGILADEMIGAAAFLVVRGNEGRAVCVCVCVWVACNKYWRDYLDWQQQSKSNLGCKQQVGEEKNDNPQWGLSSRKTLHTKFTGCLSYSCLHT